MKLLDAVNLILPKVGERAVTSLEVKHPTLAVLLPIVENIRRQLLLQGWWFNQFPNYDAYPNSDGIVVLGTDTLKFVPHRPGTAVLLGNQLVNASDGSLVFTEKVSGEITRDVQFDLLPESAAQSVWYSALVEMYGTDIGMSQELQIWVAAAQSAAAALLSEHLEQRRHHTQNLRPYRNLRRAMRS